MNEPSDFDWMQYAQQSAQTGEMIKSNRIAKEEAKTAKRLSIIAITISGVAILADIVLAIIK